MEPQGRWTGNSKPAAARSLAKHWVFTAWDEPQDDGKLPPWASYLCYGQEVCPETNRGHWQGYVELKDKRRLGPIRELFADIGVERIWLGMRLGSPSQAREYALKDGITTELGELSSKSSRQGERTDIQRIIDEIEDGSMSSVIQGCRSGAIRNHQQLKVADRLLAFCEPKRDFRPNVVVHWGPTGTGKTRLAMHQWPEAYVAPACAPRWWPGYDGHETLLVDDFRGSFMPFHELLRFLDRYPYRIEFKGGDRQLVARTMVLTSPFHPTRWYPNCGEQLQQLLRRISSIRYFYCEVDEASDVSDIKYTETDGLSPPLVVPTVLLDRNRHLTVPTVPDLDPEVGGNISNLRLPPWGCELRTADPRPNNIVLSDSDIAEVLGEL